LRTNAGIDLIGFKEKFGINFVKTFKEVISDLEEENYLEIKNSHCALTRQARAFLDSIASMFVIRDVSEVESKS
jgi:coproporphyrinogen III oxidase-like Fe-S oxidoreductase